MSTISAAKSGRCGGVMSVGGPADLTILDLETLYKIDPADWFLKGKNLPFIGEEG